MARAVWHSLTEGENLAVEAGTGVGKSLAYLVPAALWSIRTGRRIAVSTYTRLLQSQLIRQDIPLVRRLVPDCPEVAVAYGQENYLCLFRLHSRVSHGLFDTREQATQANQVLDWAEQTKEGVLLEYPHPLPAGLWARVSRESAACRGRRCPHFGRCFYFRARSTWEASSILIVNHALFFAGLATEPELLPKADAVIFDESHRLEEAAVRHFGVQVSQRLLAQTLDSVCPTTGRGVLDRLGYSDSVRASVAEEVRQCRNELERFFSDTAAAVPQPETRARLNRSLDSVPGPTLERLSEALAEVAKDADEEDLAIELIAAARRLRDSAAGLLRFAEQDSADQVRWVEAPGSGRTSLISAPLSVDSALAETVYPGFQSVVLTSATMTVTGRFDFLATRLGLRGFHTLLLDSPFDYARAGLFYASPKLPPPGSRAFVPAAAELIGKILAASRGRALVLFTSYDSMNRVAELVPNHGYSFFRQGELTVAQLLERFRADTHSVLFATQSFWQGIDVPGEALSCLMICRLPFEVPDEPRLAAICERMRGDGHEPFVAYQLPSAVLRFRQGFGRLIRSRRDRGVVCVLDQRILSRDYGRAFIDSLPKGLAVTTDVAEVADFLAETRL